MSLDIFKEIKEKGRVLLEIWPLFVTCLLLLAAVISKYYEERIEILESRIELRDDELKRIKALVNSKELASSEEIIIAAKKLRKTGIYIRPLYESL